LFIELFNSELLGFAFVLCFGVICDLACMGEFTGPALKDGELPTLATLTGAVYAIASFEDFKLLLFNENFNLSSWFETSSKSALRS